MEQMQKFRDEIDALDSELIELFGKRFDIIRQVGNYKKANNIQPLQTKRWEEILEKVTKLAQENGVDENFILKVWNEIHEYALIIESSIVNS